MGIKNILLILFLIVAFLVAGNYFVRYVYKNSESEGNKKTIATCELYKISELLNMFYQKKNKYPSSLKVVDSIGKDKLSEIRCRRELKFSDNKIYDPWGDAYVFNVNEDGSIQLFSSNSHAVKVNISKGVLE